jgi:hypothetical protein
MTIRITTEIVEALRQQRGRPLRVEDASAQVYSVLTDEQFQHYVYDDSDLTPDEMVAAAEYALNDPESWGAPGMDSHDQDDSERNS